LEALSGEPDWASNLRALIEELPGKLAATVSDDDRRSIAEQVHGLFESSGAFTRKDDDDEGGKKGEQGDPSEEGEEEPQQADSLARRWFGRH
jgi:hypothetical protein